VVEDGKGRKSTFIRPTKGPTAGVVTKTELVLEVVFLEPEAQYISYKNSPAFLKAYDHVCAGLRLKPTTDGTRFVVLDGIPVEFFDSV
jgi:hypothetical protein